MERKNADLTVSDSVTDSNADTFEGISAAGETKTFEKKTTINTASTKITKDSKKTVSLPALKATASLQLDELRKQLECSVCFNIFYKPITLGCGHTFCKECTKLAIQHTHKCPLCRFPTVLDISSTKVSSVLSNMIEKYFPESVQQGKLLEEQKLSNTATPNVMSEQTERRLYLFLYPTLVCPGSIFKLNIFEPRYVSMIERVLIVGGRYFGMQEKHDSKMGILLEIEEARRVRDGLYFVQTKCVGRYTARNTRIEETIGRNPLYVSTTTTYHDDLITEEEKEGTRGESGRNDVQDERHTQLGTTVGEARAQMDGMTLNALENLARSLTDDILQHLTPTEIAVIRERCGDSHSGPKQFSFWILSWLKMGHFTSTELLNLWNDQQLRFSRYYLVMECRNTRERLNNIILYLQGYKHVAVTERDTFYDIDGNGMANHTSTYKKNGLKELVLIMCFCLCALVLFRFFPHLLKNNKYNS
jgi:Lon protease-like protein